MDTTANSGKRKAGFGQESGGGGSTRTLLARYVTRANPTGAVEAAQDTGPKQTPEKAISNAVARAAQRCFDLPGFPVQASIGRNTIAEIVETLPERSLVMIVEGEEGTHGIVALSAGFLDAIVEVQATGRVFARPPAERRPTRTDASLCADFVNAALSELSSELGELRATSAPGRFRFASFVEDPSPPALICDDVPYDRFSLEIRLGEGGVKAGSFLAYLPTASAEHTPERGRLSATQGEPITTTKQPRGLRGAVQATPVALEAVLCRKTVRLQEMRAWGPGTTIAVPIGAMGHTQLQTRSNLCIAVGKLGEMHGQRAIRIRGGEASLIKPGAAVSDETSIGADPYHTENGVAGPAVVTGSPEIEDNVFAAETVGDGAFKTTLLGQEPPLDDIASPDAFRLDVTACPDEEGTDNGEAIW